jgi:hypothetical protein
VLGAGWGRAKWGAAGLAYPKIRVGSGPNDFEAAHRVVAWVRDPSGGAVAELKGPLGRQTVHGKPMGPQLIAMHLTPRGGPCSRGTACVNPLHLVWGNRDRNSKHAGLCHARARGERPWWAVSCPYPQPPRPAEEA